MPQRLRLLFFVPLLLCLFSGGAVSARDIRQGDSCQIEADEVIEGDLFVFCRYFSLKGRVEGNLFGAAISANIDGVVGGQVYLVAAKLDVTGSIGGSLHYAGPSILISETAQFTGEEADLIALSFSTILDGARLPDSITNVGYQLLIQPPSDATGSEPGRAGGVGGEVTFWGSTLEINAPIGGDVSATVGDPSSSGSGALAAFVIPFNVKLDTPGLRVGENGVISGTLTYSGPVAGVIEAVQPNPPLFLPLIDQRTLLPDDPISFGESLLRYFGQMVREWLMLALIGCAALLFVPRAMQFPLRGLYERPIASVGIGLIAFIISFPIFLLLIFLSALLVLAVMALGLPDLAFVLGALLTVLNFSSAGLFYFVAIFISRTVICLAIGRWLLVRVRPVWSGALALFGSMIVGALVLALMASLPVVGWFINALAAFFGLGALIVRIQTRADTAPRRSTIPVGAPPLDDGVSAAPASRFNTRYLPPPIEDDAPNPPGMDNLPQGFKWWD